MSAGLLAGPVFGLVDPGVGSEPVKLLAEATLTLVHWLQILTAATALLAAGIATGLGGSIFIAAFTAGFLFGVIGRDSGGEVSYLVDEGGEFLNAVTFIVFGAAILGPALDDLGLGGSRLRRAQSDRRPYAAGGAFTAGNRRT